MHTKPGRTKKFVFFVQLSLQIIFVKVLFQKSTASSVAFCERLFSLRRRSAG